MYEVSASGDVTLLAEGIDSPNFVALTPRGVALVSDDFDTRVFRVGLDGAVSTVVEDVPSPNGLAYSPSADALYVASTFSVDGELTRYDVDGEGIPIEATGVEILNTGPGSTNDGIAVDAEGFVYVLANLPGEIWRVDGAATSLQDGEIVVDGLESPASMAFGRGDGFDPCSAYVTELFGTRVVRVSVGVEGAPLQGEGARDERGPARMLVALSGRARDRLRVEVRGQPSRPSPPMMWAPAVVSASAS